MTKRPLNPTFTIDEYSNRIAIVPLSLNRGSVKVDEDDFHAIQAQGYHGGWYSNIQRGNSYVMVNGATNNNRSVARLIMAPPPGYVVRYKSKDRKDLRRSNLILCTRKQLKAENLGKGVSMAGATDYDTSLDH